MHLTDARRLSPEHDFGEHDVCVVGAGAAGVYVSHRLAELGARVLLLEAGGQTCVDGAALGMGLSLEGSPYRGATLGRAFGLGGTTSRWAVSCFPTSTWTCRGRRRAWPPPGATSWPRSAITRPR